MKSRLILLFTVAGIMWSAWMHAGSVDSLISLLDTTVINEAQVDLRLEIASEISNSNIKGALDYAHQALQGAEQIGSERLKAEAQLAIGKFYDYLGVRQEAIDHLIEANQTFGALGQTHDQAHTLMYIGNAYWYLSQFESALKYYSEVSIIALKTNDTALIINSINATGAVYGNINRLDSALILFREANSLSREYGSKDQEILSFYNMGDVHLYSGRIDDALGIFHDLETNYDLENNSSKHLSSLFNSMTQAFILKGEIKWARRYSEKTRLALDKYSRLTGRRDYYQNCYRIDTMENNTESALRHYTLYTALNDSLNNASFKERLANLNIYFDLQAKEIEIERLTLDNQLKDLQIRQRKIINYGSIAGIALLLTIVILVVGTINKTRDKNLLLEYQKTELEKANIKIKAQAEDLQEKNKELERVIDELKATQQHLVQSEKMASLGTLTAGIAHEINNPLNFISGGLGIIEEARKNNPDLGTAEKEERESRAIKMAFDGLERATGIVRALMTFSHKGSSKRVQTDLHEIIDNTLLFLSSKITSNITIVKDYQLKSRVPVFPDKMHQVFLNIIDNAIQAVAEVKEKKITITTQQKDKDIILTIANTGPPIEETHLNQLFDPFFTTKEPGEGTGLGLSICYTLIKDHKGTIRVENQPGEVVFIMELPA